MAHLLKKVVPWRFPAPVQIAFAETFCAAQKLRSNWCVSWVLRRPPVSDIMGDSADMPWSPENVSSLDSQGVPLGPEFDLLSIKKQICMSSFEIWAPPWNFFPRSTPGLLLSVLMCGLVRFSTAYNLLSCGPHCTRSSRPAR